MPLKTSTLDKTKPSTFTIQAFRGSLLVSEARNLELLQLPVKLQHLEDVFGDLFRRRRRQRHPGNVFSDVAKFAWSDYKSL